MKLNVVCPHCSAEVAIPADTVEVMNLNTGGLAKKRPENQDFIECHFCEQLSRLDHGRLRLVHEGDIATLTPAQRHSLMAPFPEPAEATP